jgi:hypothetical protein
VRELAYALGLLPRPEPPAAKEPAAKEPAAETPAAEALASDEPVLEAAVGPPADADAPGLPADEAAAARIEPPRD